MVQSDGTTGGALLSAPCVAALVRAGYRVVGSDRDGRWAVARRLDGTGPRLIVKVLGGQESARADAREASGGDVRGRPMNADAGIGLARLREAVRVLHELRHEHLAVVADVIDDGVLALLVAEEPGVLLTDLTDRRGRLNPAEVVTCAVPVLDALDAAASAGLCWHGEPRVVIDPLGKPIIQDVWSCLPQPAAAVEPVIDGSQPRDADAAAGLAGVAAWLLQLLGDRRHTPVPAERLRTVLERAAAGRWVGGYEALAAACFDAVTPAPIAPAPAGAEAHRSRGRGHRDLQHNRRRGLRVIASLAGAGVAGVVATGLAMALVPNTPTAASATVDDHPDPAPLAAAISLTYRRGRVLDSGCAALLPSVVVGGSPAWTGDVALLSSGVIASSDHVMTRVLAARTLEATAVTARVAVTSATWTGARTPASTAVLDLAMTPGGWRVVSTTPQAPQS